MSATLQLGNIREAGWKPHPVTLVPMVPHDTHCPSCALPYGTTPSEHGAKVWGVSRYEIPGPRESADEVLSTVGTSGGACALLPFELSSVSLSTSAVHGGKRRRNLDFLLVCDFVFSETAGLADVVLPTARWVQENGTITNGEGRVLRRRAFRKPPPGTGTDLAVPAELAHRLGHRDEAVRANGARSIGARFPCDPRATFEELRRATADGVADYAGVTWERVDAEDGVFWPCPAADRAGTPQLLEEASAPRDGVGEP